MKLLNKIVVFIAQSPVYLYKFVLSPFTQGSCQFFPSCSTYAITSINRFGAMQGYWLTAKRLARCKPFGDNNGGYDPVPYKYNGGAKWII